VFTKFFRIRIKIRLNLKILLLWTFFKTNYSYLTIDFWYLIKNVLQTRLLGSLSIFMKEKVNFRVATVVSNMYINLMHFRSKTILPMSM